MLKRIAILTWYTYQNYGTALQAVALNRAVRSLGYDAFDVQYDPLPLQHERVSNNKSLSKRLMAKIQWMRGNSPLEDERRRVAFNAFLNKCLPLTPEIITYSDSGNICKSYDAFICGSDQVWSPRCFDARYFLDFVAESRKKIAYAPSFGCDEIASYPETLEIKELISRFGSISVREESGAEIVESITGNRPQVVVDPTLLLSADEWNGMAQSYVKTANPYCLFYFLGSNAKNRKAALNIADAKGLDVLELPVFERQLKDGNSLPPNVGPAEFIDLIRNASLVCTDSFHGMVFSTIYGCPFVAFERFDPHKSDSQNTRVYNFLNMTDQTEALLRRDELSAWERFQDISIDMQHVSHLLEEAKDDSKAFLANALQYATGGEC